MEKTSQSSHYGHDFGQTKSAGMHPQKDNVCPVVDIRANQLVSLQWLDDVYPHMVGQSWGKLASSQHNLSASPLMAEGGDSKISGKREQKRRPKPRDGTVLFCGVCGDRALGYNFDAISCESCKAFFRRNALKTKPFTCSFDGNCKLDAHTRKFCSGCRMKKCFAVGMKKEWILSEDQLSKRRKRQQSRQGDSNNVTEVQPCTSSTSPDYAVNSYYPSNSSCSPNSKETAQCPPFRDQLYQQYNYHKSEFHSNNDKCDSSTKPAFSAISNHYDVCHSPSPSTGQFQFHPGHIPERKWSQCSQNSVDNSPSSSNSQHSPSYQAASSSVLGYPSQSPLSSPEDTPSSSAVGEPMPKCLKMEPFSHDSPLSSKELPSAQCHNLSGSSSVQTEPFSKNPVKSEPLYDNDEYSVPLSPYIKDMLSQLHTLYSDIFDAPYAPDQLPKFSNNPRSANELFNMTDIFIRRLIRFAKNLPEFKNLTQADQIQLLKGGIMEMFVLRSAVSFDSKRKGWKYKCQQVPSDPSKVNEGNLDSKALNVLGSSLFVGHISFVQQLQAVTGKDRLILMLLFIIELMSPDRERLKNQTLVAKCQERHLMWLKNYLESKMTIAEAGRVYPEILNKLQELRLLTDENGHLASSLDISTLAPLLVEVLDLKK
ncbi:hormone receptor 96 [Plakobranchus ocellatus]|uniref:Hormone receptor 96 n=1 Tax=Plakobranchus ocellatus TaxID=259542 RepID=A0AAV4DKD5_9GAST|nr:hormone receptor 96 [Plakobranchus ocellatus]